MALIAYARVSTRSQSPQSQLAAIEAEHPDRIFIDRASGATMDRPQLRAALDYLRGGDTLLVWRLDRLGRSLRDLIDQVEELHTRGVQFRSLTEQLDTTTASGRLTFHIFASLADFERELIRERTRAGLDAARKAGRRGGRPRVVTAERAQVARRLRAEDASLDSIAATLRVSRASVVRMLSLPPNGTT